MTETKKTIVAKIAAGSTTIVSTVAALAILGYHTHPYLPGALAPGGHFAAVLLGVYALIAGVALGGVVFIACVVSMTVGTGVFRSLGLE